MSDLSNAYLMRGILLFKVKSVMVYKDPASLMNWTPSPKQKDDAVTPAFLDIVESCSQLQKQVDCPDEYVQSLLRRIADTWAS